ncbi:MAG TPA: glycosyltransferase family 87 protein [Vicinamibacterales bacterium]|nr:glycosyltransferase family 87 protein [Vicinamibacterales bacterium]
MRTARGSVVAGWIAAVGLAVVYGVLVSRTEFGRGEAEIFSDEATYYLMAHSLASDGDLAYRREDLLRMLREFRSGPRGVFLKKGKTIDGRDDPDTNRLFFGKSFIYPLFAWPFVRVLGTTGFVVFNLVLLALAFGSAYQFLAARSGTVASLLLAFSFIFATAVPVYVVWMMPELFNFTLGVVAYFFWLFKEVSPPAGSTRKSWLRRPASDMAAVVLFGLAAFSKLTNVVMAGPMLAWLLWRGQWKRAVAAGATVGLVTAALFAVNVAVSGEWNYQGGTRATCYGDYPFQQPGQGFEVCASRGRDETLTNVLFDPEVFWTNLIANLQYFVIGRNSGLVPYFFPLVFGTIAFLLARSQRAPWQWFVLAGIVAHIGVQLILWPYTYYGSGGSVANRYFMGAYGASVFLFPPIHSLIASAIPVLIGGVFVAKMVLDPFYTSARPGRYSMTGLQRQLPVELTQTNDLPITTEHHRVRLEYGGNGVGDIEMFQVYYLDDNSYLREADRKTFWTRGESFAEFLIKTDRPCRRFQVVLSAGPVATTSTVTVSRSGGWAAAVEGRSQTVRVEPGSSQQLSFSLPPGFPYKKDRDKPAMVWVVSISSSSGFTPAPSPANDTRYLGVLVKPMVFE